MYFLESLGNEPKEALGFDTEKDLDKALSPLLQEMNDEFELILD